MKPTSPSPIAVLLRGESEPIAQWTRDWNTPRVLFYMGLILVGSGLYGAAMGCWNSPQQALYSAIKLPLVLLLAAFGNGLLNGMLAPLLGINLGFRQSLLAILISFAIASVILGGFSPIIFYLVWNTPVRDIQAHANSFNGSLLLLTESTVIAFAGIMANVRLVQLLKHLSGSAPLARRLLFSWLSVNLFLGAQLSWILRPFLGLHHGPVYFFSETPFQGNFYETIFRALRALF